MLPEGPQHREFLKGWLTVLASRSGRALTVREEADLEQALAGTLALPVASRRLSRLVEFLDSTDAEGLHARLSRWCASEEGEYAWVFDGAAVPEQQGLGSALGRGVRRHRVPGSGSGAHAGDAVPVSPGAAGARWAAAGGVDGRVREAARGSGVCGVCARRAQDLAQVERGGGVCDAVAVGRAGESDCADARRADADQGAVPERGGAAARSTSRGSGSPSGSSSSSARELTPGSRRFLVKQGLQGVVCELDLKGFEHELAVISGRAETVQLVEQLVAEYGDEPERWLPVFREARGRT